MPEEQVTQHLTVEPPADTFELIKGIGYTNQEPPAEEKRDTELPSVAPSDAIPTPPDPEQVRKDTFEREIATNPVLRAQYYSQFTGIPLQPDIQQQQFQQQQSPVKPSQQPTDTFQPWKLPDDEEFDPSNEEHFEGKLNNLLMPFQHFIQAQQQQEQSIQQQYAQQERQKEDSDAVQRAVDYLDQQLPGVKEIMAKKDLNLEEEVLVNAFIDRYGRAISKHPAVMPTANGQQFRVQLHPAIQAATIAEIAPELKKIAGLLGFQFKTQVTTEKTKALSREVYVESSNAVPAHTDDEFKRAYKSGNTVNMMAALRKMNTP